MKLTRFFGLGFPVVLGLVFLPGLAAAQETKAHDNYFQAREESVRRKAPLLIVFSTDQCVWCKHLENRTLKDAQVQTRIQKNWVPLYLNATRNSSLADALKVRQLPTLVFASPEGKIMGFLEGFVEADALIQNLDQFQLSIAKNNEELQKQESPKTLPRPEPSPKVEKEGPASQPPILLQEIRADFQSGRLLVCLEKCDLAKGFASHAEGQEAHRLSSEIRKDPQQMKIVAEQMADRLGAVYLALADAWILKGQPQQAIHYLEKTQEMLAGTCWAESAQIRMTQLQGPEPKNAGPKK